MSADFPFDSVLFDLDGTLLATDRFWIPAARVGARRAFAELGIERELPNAEDWMALVGLPLAEGFDQLFADLTDEQRAVVLERCVEEEHFALESGKAALLPGVRDVLTELKERGVRLGIASNCSQAYLDAAMERVDLAEYIEEGRCLDSRGIRNKADMIEDLLLTFGTRSAVFFGDRDGDRAAAHANGLPHVHVENGFAPHGEQVVCEGRIADFGELLPRLAGRTRMLEETLRQLGLGNATGGPRSIGVTGRSGAGKSLFGRDLVRALEARGRRAALVSLDLFLRPDRPARVGDDEPAVSPLELPERIFRVDELIESVLAPHSRGEPVALEVAGDDGAGVPLFVGEDAVLVLEGLYLLHPRFATQLDRIVHLEVPEELLLRRVAARELPLGRREEFERTRRLYLPAQNRCEAACPPAARADLVLDAANPLGEA